MVKTERRDMVKGKLEFDLPEDQENFDCALMGVEYYSVLYRLDNLLRNHLKHGHKFKTADKAIQSIRDWVAVEVNLYDT